MNTDYVVAEAMVVVPAVPVIVIPAPGRRGCGGDGESAGDDSGDLHGWLDLCRRGDFAGA